MSNVFIIGGGAAGMLAAIGAAGMGHTVTIFEKNEKLGKKMYITGKGRCNITNASPMDEILKNVIKNNKFLYSAFNSFTNEDIIKILNDSGIETKVERGNRVFPVSDKSSDVILGLSRKLREYNVDLRFNSCVKALITDNNVCKGIVLKNGNKEYADAVIVTTGGFSYQTTGSTGDGYEFAKQVGHNVSKLYPSLVPFNVNEPFISKLQGVSLKNIRATFFVDNKNVYSEFGEMLFTHFGVSGPVVLSASSFITEKLNSNCAINMEIDLKPALPREELDSRITRDFKKNINKDFRNSLNELLPRKLIPVIVEKSGIDGFKKVNEITKEERNSLVRLMKGFKFKLASTRGFNEAIITRGGIDVKEINPRTMESKLVKNLYFAGEVLDVDALTGGYNLQIAYSTGYLAGVSVEWI